jgi:hypothetical protein
VKAVALLATVLMLGGCGAKEEPSTMESTWKGITENDHFRMCMKYRDDPYDWVTTWMVVFPDVSRQEATKFIVAKCKKY